MVKWAPVVAVAIMVLVVGALVGMPLVVGWREARQDRRRIMANGTIAQAQVTEIGPPSADGACAVSFTFLPSENSHAVAGKQDTTATAIAAARIAVGSSVRVNYLPKRPSGAFIDVLTRAELGAALFYVSFRTVPNTASSKNNYGWSGNGEVVFDSGRLRITANRRRTLMFPKKQQRKIALNDVINVEHFGDMVRFEVLDPGENPQKLQFQTVNAAEADAISQKLPSTRTEGFAPILAEQAAFSNALISVTPTTPVTLAMILANLLMFAIATSLGAGLFKVNPAVMIRLGTDYTPLTLSGQWWRLLTSTFLHFGLLHIAFNMFALYVNGIAAERIFGSRRYLVIYLAAGICGSVASLLWHPLVNGAGASGAIFGVLGALIAFFVKKEGGVPPSVLKTQLRAASIFVVYNLIYGAGYQGIDNAAHLGGLAGGFVMGFILSRPLHADRNSRDWTRQWLVAAVAVCLASVSFVCLVADRSDRSRPTIRSLGGFRLRSTPEELIAAKGQPIHRAASDWVYNSVDSRHNGVVTAAFGANADDVVRLVEYIGDQASAPSELPYLNGMSKDAVIKKYAPVSVSQKNPDGTVSVWFANGVFVTMKEAVVVRYGIYDTAGIGN
jgi:rhomboid protease GluP